MGSTAVDFVRVAALTMALGLVGADRDAVGVAQSPDRELLTVISVANLEGRPTSGATVQAQELALAGGPPPSASATCVTDALGTCRLKLRVADYVVSVAHPRYARASGQIWSNRLSGEQIDFVLVRGGSISGHVVDGATHKGIPGAKVVAYGQLPIGVQRGDSSTNVAFSEPDGAFRIDGLRPGLIGLTAVAGELTTAAPTLLPLALGGRIADVEMRLDAGRHLKGVVRAAGTSGGVSGLEVGARDAITGEWFPASAVTDSNGAFRVSGLRRGTYEVAVRGDAQEATIGSAIDVGEANDLERAFSLDLGETVFGRLVPPVDALVRARVVPDDSTLDAHTPLLPAARACLTGADGWFLLRGLPRGTVLLEAVTADGRRGHARVPVGRGASSGVVLPLAEAGRIAGRVVDIANRPERGTWVMVNSAPSTPEVVGELEDRTVRRRVKERAGSLDVRHEREVDDTFRYLPVNANGEFETTGLAAGAYELRVFRDGALRAWAHPAAPDDPDAPILVNVVGTGVARTELVVTSCLGRITGTITDPRGAPLSGVWVTATKSDAPREAWSESGRSAAPTLSNDAGRFVLGDLCASTYDVTAYDLEGVARAVSPSMPVMSDISLSVRATSTLAGLVRLDGLPVKDFVLILAGVGDRVERRSTSDGRFVLPWLASGTYSLRAESRDGYASTWIDIEPDAQRTADVKMTRWASLHGRLLNARREPVRSARVALRLGPPTGAAVGRRDSADQSTRRTTTDAEGRFAFERLDCGPARLSFFHGVTPLFARQTDYGTIYGATVGPGPSLAIELPPGIDDDLGVIDIENDERPAALGRPSSIEGP